MGAKTKLLGLLACGLLLFGVMHYRELYYIEIDNKNQVIAINEQLKNDIKTLESQIDTAHSIDKQKTEELNREKAKNNDLRERLQSGAGGLYIKTNSCPNVPNAASASGVDNGNTARLTDANQQDYLLFRDRESELRKMLEGAQRYINEVCLKRN